MTLSTGGGRLIGALPRAAPDRQELLVVGEVRVAAGVDAVEGLEHLARLRCVVRRGAEGEQALEVELRGGEELLGVDRRGAAVAVRAARAASARSGSIAAAPLGQRSGQDPPPGNPTTGRLEIFAYRHYLPESDTAVAT